MELLNEAARAEIIAEIDEFLKCGDGQQFGDFIGIPLKSTGGRVIQGALGEVMHGRYPYSDIQYQHEMFVEIARALRNREPYPLLGLDAGTSVERKILEVLTLFARPHPAQLSPTARLVQDLGIVNELGIQCLVSISYRCAIDITSIDFREYFFIGTASRIRHLFHLPIRDELPRRTLTVGQLLCAAKIGKLSANGEHRDTGKT
jgi:hypothetical protein